MTELGSEMDQRPDGQVFQQSTSSQSNQPNPNPDRDASHAQGHEQSMLNEVDIDFRILGLPHAIVKEADNSRVRESVKKIENYLHRHVLQRDLQQNKAHNPFRTTTKANGSGRGQCRAV